MMVGGAKKSTICSSSLSVLKNFCVGLLSKMNTMNSFVIVVGQLATSMVEIVREFHFSLSKSGLLQCVFQMMIPLVCPLFVGCIYNCVFLEIRKYNNPGNHGTPTPISW